MKSIVKAGVAALALTIMVCASADAQQRQGRNGGSEGQKPDRSEWYQKMKAQKIAFFTSEIGLTQEEAKAFWPIYDAAEQAQRQASHKVMEAYRNLMKAVHEDKPDAEVEKLLDAYVQATGESRTVDPAVIAQYEKILPAKKVAKIFIAEEKFRQQQIRQLHSQGHQGDPRGGNEGGHGGPQNGFHGGPRGGNDAFHGHGQNW